MSLFTEALSISALIAVLGIGALVWDALRRHSRFFFLLGTGALAGILFVDLLPDLAEFGGTRSLLGAFGIWVVYSLFHVLHLKHHKPASEDGAHSELHHHAGESTAVFLLAMIAHCVASGFLLVASEGINRQFNRTVFLALLSHKAYEALTVSAILIEREKSKAKAAASVALYAASLPVGVGLAYLLRSELSPGIVTVIMSVAAGTLLSCLVFDFLLPSLTHIRARRMDLAWIAVGLLATRLFMGGG